MEEPFFQKSCNSSLFLFEKGQKTEEVWFFEHPYPKGYKSYSRSKPLRIKEFEREKAWWNNREVNEYAWQVSAKEIVSRNYNLDCKNPYEEEIELGDPEELMAEFLEISQEVREIQEGLKVELIEALGSRE